MALLDRIFGETPGGVRDDQGDGADDKPMLSPEYHAIKSKVHNRLFDFIDPAVAKPMIRIEGRMGEISNAMNESDLE